MTFQLSIPAPATPFKAADVLDPHPSKTALAVILQALPVRTRETLHRNARRAQRRVVKTGGRVSFEFGGVTYHAVAREVLPFLRGIANAIANEDRPDEFDQTTAVGAMMRIAEEMERTGREGS